MVFNSFILYNKYSENKLSLYDFRLFVTESLLPSILILSRPIANTTKCISNGNGRKMWKRYRQCFEEGKHKDTCIFHYVKTQCKCPGKPGLYLKICLEKYHLSKNMYILFFNSYNFS